MIDTILHWIDVIWVPIIFFGVHKKHRWWALGFVTCSMIIMRIIVETYEYIGYPNGILGIMTSNVHSRGLIITIIFYSLYLLMAHYSKKTEGVVFMAASLTFFFAIFVTCCLIMVL